MRYIIAESRFNNILDKLFIDRYGSLPVKDETPEGYVYFLDNQPSPEKGIPFEMNVAGTLWVNDYTFFKKIKSLFGLKTSSEENELFKNYFQDRYGVKIKTISSEGGYHHPNDPLDDNDDPWLDEY